MNVRLILALAVPAFVAACATTETPKDNGAASSTPSSSTSSSASSASTPSGTPGGMSTAAAAGMPAQRSVYYDFDKSEVRPGDRAPVEANAKYLRDNPAAKVTVEGNCDERGSREYNLALGQRRSEGVVKMMRLLGAKDGQMEATSFGKEKPKSGGHDESSWQENRRSDIVYR